MRKRILLISTLYLLGIGYSQAQLFSSKKNYNKPYKAKFEPYSSVGFGLGTASYYGELSPINDPINATFKMMRWNVTANYTRHFTPRFSGRAALTWARLAGDDYTFSNGRTNFDGNFVRNLHFRNDVKELSAVAILNILPEGRNAFDRPFFLPYIFGGLAVFAHNPKARTPERFGNNWVSLQPLGTEGQGQPGGLQPYSLVSASIPIGIGFRFRYKRNWDISAEAGIRFAITDYLDDVGGGYAEPSSFAQADGLGVAMSDRSREQIAARKGGDRTQELRRIIASQPENAGLPPNFNPFDRTITIEGSGPGYPRGGGNKDIYLLTAIHVNYIIAPKIKCPPLR